jgi:hypothetical protein
MAHSSFNIVRFCSDPLVGAQSLDLSGTGGNDF